MSKPMILKRLLVKLFYTTLVICISTLYFSCNKNNQDREAQTQLKVDSLIITLQDSISNNSPYVNGQLNYAFSIVNDSMKYYELLNLKAFNYILTDAYDSAYLSLDRILKFCKKEPDTLKATYLRATTYNTMGVYFSRTGKPDSAIFYYQRSYDALSNSEKKERHLSVTINLADAYLIRANYTNAASYFRKALFLSDSLNVLEENGFQIYFGLGQVYMHLRDFGLSDYYFNLAEKTLNSQDLLNQFTFCNNRGNYYYYSEQYSKALPWFKKARALVLPGNYQYAINICELNMSDIFLQLNQLDSAQYYSEKVSGFFTKINHHSALYYLATIKAGIAIGQNKPMLVNSFLKNNTDTTGIQKDMVSIRNRYLRDYYAQIGDYKQAYQYAMQNFQLEDSIQSERIKGRVAEMDTRYKQDTTILKRDLVIKSQSNEMTSLRYSRYLIMFAALFVAVIAGFVFIYMRKKRDLMQVKHFETLRKSKLENARNRVSPHFLFNSLNTIYDELNDKPVAQKRLKAIVSMLRSSLTNIEKPSISLKEEIEFVEHYILLQKERFIPDLEFDMRIESEELYNYNIPAMFIQIPVENAIKHGLAPKIIGDKRLIIDAKRINGTIKIGIENNGIARASEKSIASTKGTGTGLKVISQTMHALNKKNEEKIQFSIIDKKDDLGNDCGTRVEISIPVNFNYEI